MSKTHQFKGSKAVRTNAQWEFTLQNAGGTSFPCTKPNTSDSSKCTTNKYGNNHKVHYSALPADTYTMCEQSFSNWQTQYKNLPPGSTISGRCLTFTLAPGEFLTSDNDSQIRVNNFCPKRRRLPSS